MLSQLRNLEGSTIPTMHLLDAVTDGRVMVTQDYRDFAALNSEFQDRGIVVTGILLLPNSMATNDFAGIAAAIVAYDRGHPEGMAPYMMDFLRKPK
jgi:hypothetical protein